MKGAIFEAEYKKLNKAQKEAVETIEGPVMVIAGPGTGKTQVLSLRIANILKQTDTPADGVLCLTFTNSGVEAMKKRLKAYGVDATKVTVSTFHSFGTKLIEEFHTHLGLHEPPTTLDEASAVGLVDDVLNSSDWAHLRPRGDAARYFKDLKSLVSLLIREQMTPEEFEQEIDKDIDRIKKDPENISSRGTRKGELKKEALTKIESLERSREAVRFYELYEKAKQERNLFDYDDILRAMVRLVADFEDVRATLRERHLYVLVDEHQDSSGIQNEFLKLVWGPVEKPNVFVVGDDRQLIYGFSGASLSLFEEFKDTFPGTKHITLTENYRSTQRILDAADVLLTSVLAKGKLSSNTKGDHPILLSECAYERDEVQRAGIFFKERIEEGIPAEECALLVPKNFQVKAAVRILEDQGLEAYAAGAATLFAAPEYQSLATILKLVVNPFDAASVAAFILDRASGIPVLEAQKFLHTSYARDLSVEALAKKFDAGEKLSSLVEKVAGHSAYEAIQQAGEAFLLQTVTSHEEVLKAVEVVRTLLHLAMAFEQKSRGKVIGLAEFLPYLARLEEYGEDIPLATFDEGQGIRVMTLHRSKGLEFEAVWIAHLSERGLMSGKRMSLALPERLKVLEEKKDQAAARRELYVALTRAKRFAALSYPLFSHTGADEELAAVLEEMPRAHFDFEDRELSTKKILALGPAESVVSRKSLPKKAGLKEIQKLVTEHFEAKKVSASALNSFFDCPWQWYFRYFLGLPEPKAEVLTFGSVVHGAIEISLKDEGKKLDDVIEGALDAELVFEPHERRRMKTDAAKALKRFKENLLPELYDEKEVERRLSGKDTRFPGLTFTGAIDLMEHAGGTVRLTDFKTGRPRKASEIEKRDDEGRMSSYLRQLAMYSYLLGIATKGQYEVEKSRLYFAESDDPTLMLYETVIGNEELELLRTDIKDYADALEKGSWTKRPCNHKGAGREECSYCALKERLFE